MYYHHEGKILYQVYQLKCFTLIGLIEGTYSKSIAWVRQKIVGETCNT